MTTPRPTRPEETALGPEHYAGLVGEYLKSLTPSQRCDFFETITAPYCTGCGGPRYSERGRRCQCQNDE